ncbi:MAG: hypothetical protein IJ496_08940 [Ruminococcus sp.]|nr:hypothetical protein [Ruminococcus sp.]
MYLNKLKAGFIQVSSIILFIISGYFLATGIMALLLIASGNQKLRESLLVYIAMLIIALIAFVPAARMLRELGKARKIAGYFSGDTDGTISVETAAAALGLSQRRLMQQFDFLMKKGYLLNCHMVREPVPQFILSRNTGQAANERFQTISCPNCGAPNMVQKGFLTTCEYCQSEIRSK